MKQVAELTKNERVELEKKEKELRGLEAAKGKRTSVTGVVPAELKKSGSGEHTTVSHNLRQAKEDYKKAQIAMQARLKEVKSNKDFQEAAQQHAEAATDRFLTDFKGETEKAKAATRMLSSLSQRLNFNSQAAAKAAAKPGKAAAKAKAAAAPSAAATEEQLKAILNEVRKANTETPAALFRSLGGWTGAGAISPMIFTSFMLKHAPDITRQQIGALWWRADTNNDGQVDLNEFKDFFAKYVETSGSN